MNRDSSIIPKIIVILGIVSVLGIILLFFRPRSVPTLKLPRPSSPDKLFAQVILAAQSDVLKLWEEGDRFIKKEGLRCPEEVLFDRSVGRSYYQCQPHFWQCFWDGGVSDNPGFKIDLFGQTFTVRAKRSFAPVAAYSPSHRFYEIVHGPFDGLNFHFGMMVDLEVAEIPGYSWPMILTDTCRDTFLPERVYSYSTVDQKKDEGMLWDSFDRRIFIDRFYVTNQQVNEWRILTGNERLVVSDRKQWPLPAALSRDEQIRYCAFWGKRLLEAKLFEAAAMPPEDSKEPIPSRILRPDTPWQRDLAKTYLGMARINPDYQLTPLDCQLAEVRGCPERPFTTDSVSWMGMNYVLGYYPESLVNEAEPEKNLKSSSRYELALAEDHQIGFFKSWEGKQTSKTVAFRCYEEVSP